MNNLAGVLHDQQKHEEAEELFRRVVEGRRRVLGNDHSMTVTAVQNLADVLSEHGNPAEAAPLWKEAYETSLRLHGPDESGTMFGLQRYAQTLADLGRHAEAEPLLKRAVDYDRNRYGQTHESTMVVEGYLALSLQALGNLDEAELLLRRSVDTRLQSLGATHRSTLTAQHNLAGLLADRKQYDEGERLFESAAQGKRAALSPNDPSLANTLSRWAQMRSQREDFAGAIPLFRESLAILAHLNPSHPGLRNDSLRLATALVRTGEAEEAERIARDITEKQRRQLGPSHLATALAELVLGECLVARRGFEEAEALLLQAYETLRMAPGVPIETLTRAAEQIARLYESWGKPDQAAEWRAKRPRE
jgi:tetratricopeptide (TPR) repeat protein